jgi:putative ABC transport system permease protein
MQTRQYLSSIVESLFINKIRTALAMLGIVIGIAAVVSLLSIGESNAKQLQSEFTQLGTNLITVSGLRNNLTPRDLEAITGQKTFATRGISAELSQYRDIAVGRKTKEALVTGATAAYLDVHNTSLRSGTFVTDNNLSKNSRTVVLGPEIARYFFGEDNPLGQKVVIQDQNYTVIGITTAKGGDALSSPDMTVYVPLSTAQNRVFGTPNYSSISLSLTNSSDTSQAKSSITALLRARHKLSASQEADFQVQDQQEILQTLASVSGSMSKLLAAIAAISLIVGGIGIMNVMLVSVIERTGEIGLRKAVGAKKGAVVAQFLGEATVLTVVGGGIGVLVGYGVSVLIFSITSQPYAFSLPAVALSLAMSSTIGILFGWYPAWKAAKLSPIEALRYE